MTLGELLKKSRKSAGYTLEISARNIGVSIGYLHDLESGRKFRPKMRVLRNIADFYAIDYDNLCITAERIPQLLFFKIIRCPQLLQVIRDYPE